MKSIFFIKDFKNLLSFKLFGMKLFFYPLGILVIGGLFCCVKCAWKGEALLFGPKVNKHKHELYFKSSRHVLLFHGAFE